MLPDRFRSKEEGEAAAQFQAQADIKKAMETGEFTATPDFEQSSAYLYGLIFEMGRYPALDGNLPIKGRIKDFARITESLEEKGRTERVDFGTLWEDLSAVIEERRGLQAA